MERKKITHRSEILFIFETVNNNPNGNPLFDNQPRIEQNTGLCYISTSRIKRTIRDYIRNHEDKMVLINNYEAIPESYLRKKISFPSGVSVPLDIETTKQTIFHNFIDSRMFGFCFPLKGKNKSFEFYGPVQFTFAKSFLPVQIEKIQGTAAFASRSGKSQRSLRAEYIIPYAIFCTKGIINENAAQITNLSKNDVSLLDKSIWNSTNSLHSRTKIGFKSRLLMRIEYKEKNFQMNLSSKLINVIPIKDIESCRSIDDLIFNLDDLKELMKAHQKKIDNIHYQVDNIRIENYSKIEDIFNELNLNFKEVSI